VPLVHRAIKGLSLVHILINTRCKSDKNSYQPSSFITPIFHTSHLFVARCFTSQRIDNGRCCKVIIIHLPTQHPLFCNRSTKLPHSTSCFTWGAQRTTFGQERKSTKNQTHLSRWQAPHKARCYTSPCHTSNNTRRSSSPQLQHHSLTREKKRG